MKATFVFAVYLDELKKSWREAVSEVDLINLLYDAVSEPANLKNQNGETISVKKGTASKIFHREKGGNVNRAIRQHSHDQSVLSTVDSYFEKFVVKRLLQGSEENLIHRLDHHIQADQSIAEQIRNELHQLAQKKTLARFLARAYIESLQPDNVAKIGDKLTDSVNQEDAKHHPLKSAVPPGLSSANESRYTTALMKVYAEDAHVDSIVEKELDGPYIDYKPHFTRQRSDYFAAEAIRRGTRDFYADDEEEYFTILEKEIFDGIIDVWEKPTHDDGFTRLRETLAAAVQAPVDQCWLARDTVWIGNAQKKGCAMCWLMKANWKVGW